MVKICVIALVGLPASGKTRYCKTILKSSIEFDVIHMCYDEMFTFLPQTSEIAFKGERKKVLQKLKEVINSIKSNKYPIEGAAHSKQSNYKAFLIICDDNNYYAGMRYEICKICKEYQLSFGQIYFPVNLKDALLRNSLRGDGALPTVVIEKMYKRLEEPSERNQWERNTLTIRGDFDIDALQSFLKICLDNPFKSTSKPERLCTEKLNVVHEIDILLRKRIKDVLQATDGDLSKTAKVLNERRKKILSDARKKEILQADSDLHCVLERLHSD